MSYNSTPDTLDHIAKVRLNMKRMADNLNLRAKVHDESKLNNPEKEAFDIATPKLKELKYGTPEYHAATAELGEALEHHYRHNSHHPQHYKNGIVGMSLLDLLEMLADWKAAGERMADGGDIRKSLEINRERFNIPDELYYVLTNTITEMGW